MSLTNHKDDHASPIIDSWASVVKGLVRDGVVKVWIEPSLPKPVKKHIRKVLKEVGRIPGIEIKIVKKVGKASIRLYDEEETYGLDHPTANRLGGLTWASGLTGDIHAAWKFDRVMRYNKHLKRKKDGTYKAGHEMTDYGKYVIAHEILHGFGLSHPEKDGRTPGYTTKKTLMSYNWRGGWKGALPQMDVDALTSIWGS
jgi:hypothetical protein